MDLDQHHRIGERDVLTEDGATVVESVTQDTDALVYCYRLDFHTGNGDNTQMIYAATMPEALTLALETIRTITEWEGSPDTMTLTETGTD